VDGLGPGSGGVSPAEPGACLDLGALGPTSFETPKVPVAGEGSQNSLRGPLKTIQERIGHALTESFTWTCTVTHSTGERTRKLHRSWETR
jgi:hypothetical protein